MATDSKVPWWLAVGVAGLVVTAATWLRVPTVSNVLPPPPPAALVLTRPVAEPGQEVLRERLAAYDPTPLFLPTEMGSGRSVMPGTLRPAAAALAEKIGAKLEFSAEGLSAESGRELKISGRTPVPDSPTAVDGLRLTERVDAPLAIGRADHSLGKLPTRLGVVEAVSAGSGEKIWELTLSPSADAPVGDWQPLELVGTVATAGLAGDLVVTRSSGRPEEVDDFFRRRLMQLVRVGERLPPGIYVFRVGP